MSALTGACDSTQQLQQPQQQQQQQQSNSDGLSCFSLNNCCNATSYGTGSSAVSNNYSSPTSSFYQSVASVASTNGGNSTTDFMRTSNKTSTSQSIQSAEVPVANKAESAAAPTAAYI